MRSKDVVTRIKAPCGCVWGWHWTGYDRDSGWIVDDAGECRFDAASPEEQTRFDEFDPYNIDVQAVMAGYAMAHMGVGR